MMRKIAIGAGTVIALLVGGAYLLPSVARVERSVVVKAMPEEVFAMANDLTLLKEWSPWFEPAPGLTYAIDSGSPPLGAGARISWQGGKAGSGSLHIVESEPFSVVRVDLVLGGSAPATATMALRPTEGGTKVSWSVEKDLGMNPVARYLGLTADGSLGPDLARGLERLKQAAEAASMEATMAALAQSPAGKDGSGSAPTIDADPSKGPEVVTLKPRPIIKAQGRVATGDDAAVSGALSEAIQKILAFAEANQLEVGGGAGTVVTLSNDGGNWVFEATLPLASAPGAPVEPADGVSVGQSYVGRAVRVTHKGAYSSLPQSFDRVQAYAREKGLTTTGIKWEEYISDPGEVAEPDLLTNVYIAVE